MFRSLSTSHASPFISCHLSLCFDPSRCFWRLSTYSKHCHRWNAGGAARSGDGNCSPRPTSPPATGGHSGSWWTTTPTVHRGYNNKRRHYPGKMLLSASQGRDHTIWLLIAVLCFVSGEWVQALLRGIIDNIFRTGLEPPILLCLHYADWKCHGDDANVGQCVGCRVAFWAL